MAQHEAAFACAEEWRRTAAADIANGRATTWVELHRITKETLKALTPVARKVTDFQITGVEGRNLQLLRVHTENLLSHVSAGKGLGFGPFRPRTVKEAFYLTTEVVVDGQLCKETSALSKLMTWIQVHEHLGKLERDWSSYVGVPQGSPALQFAFYEGAATALEWLLSLSTKLGRAREALKCIPSLPEPNWREASDVLRILRVLKAVEARVRYAEANRPICDLEKRIYSETLFRNSHPEIRRILEDARARNVQGYAASYERLLQVQRLRASEAECSKLFGKLRSASPALAGRIEADLHHPEWEVRLSMFVEAWNWARCCGWLSDITDPNAFDRLTAEIDSHRSRIKDRLRRIAAARAWAACFAPNRMREEQRQHLRAWATAVRRIGRGTGKHANLHRQAAREHMEHCRPAIPAWIMPIFRIAETVTPEPGAFDVAIVDEASQSGPEALFLLYLAKRIIVVGDDKQISPDFVGLNRDDVQLLRQRRVADLPHADALGADDSFFNIAEIRYSGRIRLREHFRCMPEIIQFSNNLCYPSEPLVPLRQYGMARLAPVVTLHVADGYQKGVSPRITNPPEAEALVSKIAECCGDHRYRDKSMGVISLLGEDQARYIEKLLLETVGPEEMERRKLVCGDAYAFQGDERDVIFLSMVSAPTEGHRIATLGSPRDERRFNVAASRARDQLWLVHTATLNDLSPRCLRYRLLEYCQNPHIEPTAVEGVDFTRLRSIAKRADREFGTAPDPFGSWFEVDVFLDVVGRRYRVIPQMQVAGYSIDLVVEGMEGRVAIECDGDRWHGADVIWRTWPDSDNLKDAGGRFGESEGRNTMAILLLRCSRSGHYLASWASIHAPETMLSARLNPLVFKSRSG